VPRRAAAAAFAVLGATPLLGAQGGVDVARLFLVLAAMLVGAKILGEAAERIGQPAVLGELVAGVLLGSSVLGIIPTEGTAAELVHVFAELGVLLLLFEIGLATDLRDVPGRSCAPGGGLRRRGLPFALACLLVMPPSGGDRRRPDDRRHLRRCHATATFGITARVSDLG
jgi:hypothetical protein